MMVSLNRANGFFEQLPQRIRNKRVVIALLIVVSTMIVGYGMKGVVIDESLTSYFHQDDPVKKAYDRFRTVFGGDEYLYVVYRAKDGDIFSKDSLNALKGIHDDLTRYRSVEGAPENMSAAHKEGKLSKHPLDHIQEIKSLINVQYMEAEDNTLFSRNFIGERLPTDAAQREGYRAKALAHPDYPLIYLSKDSQYGGIVIRTDFNAEKTGALDADDSRDINGGRLEDQRASGTRFDDDDDDLFEDAEIVGTPVESGTNHPIVENRKKGLLDKDESDELISADINEYPVFMTAVRDIINQESYTDALEFYPVGQPAFMDFFAVAVFQDMGKLMGLVLLLIVVMLRILFRSFAAVVWPLLIIVLTLVWTLGIVGWSGIAMSAMIQVIVFLSLAVGIADTVHILSGYIFFRNGGLAHRNALDAVMKKSGLACLLTSVTTAVGLLALTLVPLKPIAVFGLFAALAVFLAFFFTVLLLPLLLDLWAPVTASSVEINPKKHLILQGIKKIEHWGLSYPSAIILVFAVSGVFLFGGLCQLKVDSNLVEIIKEGLPLRHAYQMVDAHMGGSSNMEIMLDFGTKNALKRPKVLFAMEALQQFLEGDETTKIVKTHSLVNVVKDAFQTLNEDRPSMYRIPEDPGILEQVLFLFENANYKDRKRLVTDDYANARIGINAVNVGSIESMAIMERVQGFIDKRFGNLKAEFPELQVTLTGGVPLMATMLDYIAWAQIKSFGLALLVISGILLLVLGSLKAGVAALAPNLFPILTSFGLMGYFGIPLDADTLLIAPIIIGIAVDDTIHFMTHYRLEMESSGNITKAAIDAVREAGQAITFTSLILSVGFLVFIRSFHNGLSHFGIFASIAITAALISDLLLLPALCRAMNIDFNLKQSPSHSTSLITSKTVLGWGGMMLMGASLLGGICFVNDAFASSPNVTNTVRAKDGNAAREIIRRVLDRNDGTTEIGRITLSTCSVTKKGNRIVCSSDPRVKRMDMIRKDYGPREKDHKSVTILVEPAGEKGIGFLQYDYEALERETDQWLYLSALGKVKRIVSGNENEPKTGSFFGSEFSYEDMEKRHLDDYTYKILGEERHAGVNCVVIEALPTPVRAEKSNYSKALEWVDRQRDMTLKTVLYDRRGRKIKKVYYRKIQSVDDILVPMEIVVLNLESRRKTSMRYEEIALNVPVDDRFLTQRTLTDGAYRETSLATYRSHYDQ